MFRKNFPNLTPAQIEVFADHARAVATALAGHAGIVCPQVLAQGESHIDYTWLDCSSGLHTAILEEKATAQDTHKIGQALQQIHNHKLRHADFVPHNVFYIPEGFVITDPHPPAYAGYDTSFFAGPPEREVMRFIYVTLTSYGLRRSLQNGSSVQKLVQGFVSGYGARNIRPGQIFLAALPCALEVYRIKRLARTAPTGAAGHAALGYFMAVIATLRARYA